MFQKSSSSENKIWIRGRVSRFFVGNFLSHSAGKTLRGTLLCSNEILVMKTFVHRRAVITFFWTFFVKQYRKIS